MILGLMERFNYPNIAAVLEESTDILWLLDCESYGDKRDQNEELERLKLEAEVRENQNE